MSSATQGLPADTASGVPKASATANFDPFGRSRWVLPIGTIVVLVVALGLWWWALKHTPLGSTGGLGLVNAFPLMFYVAVGLVVASTVASLVVTPLSRLAALANLTTFVVMIFGAPAVLYQEPEYAWTYKHLGVIRYIELHGSTNRAIDVYQNWPGFFTANAWLDRATGIDPGAYAAWAPVFFDLCLLAGFLYALGGLIADPRRRYAAAFVWVLGSWVGQDYLSPQAMSIVISVVMLGIVLRVGTAGGWNRDPRTPIGRFGDRLRDRCERTVHWVVRRPQGAASAPVAPVHGADGPRLASAGEGPRPALPTHGPAAVPILDPSAAEDLELPRLDHARGERHVGVFLLLLIGAPMITSHQLSPVMLLVSLLAIIVMTGWRRLWSIMIVLVIAQGVWVALAWPSLRNLGIFDYGSAVPTPSVTASNLAPLPGVNDVQYAKELIILAFGLLGVAGVWRMLRRDGTDPSSVALLVALAAAPFFVVPVQSYGGEAGLRAYLFSLPWLAVLAVEAIWPSGTHFAHDSVPRKESRKASASTSSGAKGIRLGSWRARPWLLAVLAPVLASGLIVAYYGQALADQISPSDVAAASWAETNVSPGTGIVGFSDNFPLKLTARYPLANYSLTPPTDDPATLKALQQPGQAVDGVRALLNKDGIGVAYLVISPSMRNFDRLHGVITQSDIDSLIGELRIAPDFTLVYDQAGSYIFKYQSASSP